MPKFRKWLLAALLSATTVLATLLLVSCQTGAGPRSMWLKASAALVWPQPPEAARIRYVGAVRASHAGGKEGVGNRVARWVTGKRRVRMRKPMAVAKNEAGLMAVCDPGVPTVHFFDLVEERDWTLKPKLAAKLRMPVGVAVDKEGTVFVADSALGRVFVFDGSRKMTGEMGEGKLSRPTGLALSPSEETLYVVDTIGSEVFGFDREGNMVLRFGKRGGAPGEFNYPTDIAVAPNGDLCVSDSLNFRVQVFSPSGEAKQCFGRAGNGAGDFARPKGIGVDTEGRIYVVDAAFENVQIFSPEGELLLAFGGQGTGPGQFSLPAGLFMDANDRIWIADSFNRRIQVFQLIKDAQP